MACGRRRQFDPPDTEAIFPGTRYLFRRAGELRFDWSPSFELNESRICATEVGGHASLSWPKVY